MHKEGRPKTIIAPTTSIFHTVFAAAPIPKLSGSPGRELSRKNRSNPKTRMTTKIIPNRTDVIFNFSFFLFITS